MTLLFGILYYFFIGEAEDAKTDSEDTEELLTFITFEQYIFKKSTSRLTLAVRNRIRLTSNIS
jgi:hypothetical protein